MRLHPTKLFFFVLIVSVCWLVVRPQVHNPQPAEEFPLRVNGAAQLPKHPPAIHLAGGTLTRYTGEYRIPAAKIRNPATGDTRTVRNLSLFVTAEHGSLYVQTTGLPKLEMLAESEKMFFFSNVDARIEFVADTTGRMKALAIRLPGQDDLIGNRIR